MLKEQIRELLQRFWGFRSFRPLQEEIIMSALEGHDTLALLPTGGGKSICYQVPALATEGLCLVITPLIALMKDQLEGLERKGIRALAIYSGMTQREIDIAFDNAAYGNYKFLFLSPERLETDLFRERALKLNVNLIAVDEAHCISEWGFDFRPSYLKIKEVKKFYPDVPVLALTATATRRVRQDITEHLEFGEGANTFVQSFDRPNLVYAVINEEDKYGRLLKLFNKVPGSALVYAGTRNHCRSIAEFLKKNGLSADHYHAGLENEERARRQEEWKKGHTRIMVCTNAFGMGIDKPDVRLVVHYEIPQSLEAYYQEAGRAGRDGRRSYAIALFNAHDRLEMEAKAKNSLPLAKDVKQVYQALGNYLQLPVGSGIGQSFDLNLPDFCHRFDLNPLKAYNALKVLERAGYLSFTESVFLPSRLMVTVDNHTLYSFEIANRAYEPIIKLILRSYGGCFESYVPLNEDNLAYRLSLPVNKVKDQLKKLKEYDLIDYQPRKNSPQVTYLTERLGQDNLQLDARYMAERLEIFSSKLKAIIEYATYDGCRGRKLLAYFDEDSGKPCGHCDHCLKDRKEDPAKLQEMIKQQLQNGPVEPEKLLNLMNVADERLVMQQVRYMVDNKIIYMREGRYLSLEK